MPETELDIVLKARDQATKTFDAVENRTRRFGASLRKTFLSIGAAIAAIGLGRQFKRFGDEVDRTAKLSDRLGTTTEFLATLGLQSEKTGVNIETMSQALSAFVRRTGEAQRDIPNKSFLTGFTNLGIDVNQFRGEANEIEKLYLKVADAIGDLETQQGKLAAADLLFSEAGRKLVPVLQQQADGFRDFAKQAEDLGLLFSREEAREIEEFNDAITDLGKAFRGLGRFAVPVLQQVTDGINGLLGKDTGAKTADELGKFGLVVNRTAIFLEELFKTQDPQKAKQATDIRIRAILAERRNVEALADEVRNLQDARSSGPSGFGGTTLVNAPRPTFLEGIGEGIDEVEERLNLMFLRGRDASLGFLTGLQSDWDSLFFAFIERRIRGLENVLSAFFRTILSNLARLAAAQTSDALLGLLAKGLGSVLTGTPNAPSSGPGTPGSPFEGPPLPAGFFDGQAGAIAGITGGGPGYGGPAIGQVIINTPDAGTVARMAAGDPQTLLGAVITAVNENPSGRLALRTSI